MSVRGVTGWDSGSDGSGRDEMSGLVILDVTSDWILAAPPPR